MKYKYIYKFCISTYPLDMRAFILAILLIVHIIVAQTLPPKPVVQQVVGTSNPTSASAEYSNAYVLFGVSLCYTNNITLPYGAENNFGELGTNEGQLQTFQPGWTYNAANISVNLTHADHTITVTWNLGNQSASVTFNSKNISSVPTVVFGNNVTLCTQTSVNGSGIYTPYHPFKNQNVVSITPRATSDAQSLTGKYCLVIGGCHGLGFELSKAYTAAGCTVLATSRSPKAYQNLTGGVICHPQRLDVRHQSQIDTFFDQYVDTLPSLTIVHYNPGIASFGSAQFFRSGNIRHNLDVNCLGLIDVAFRAYIKMNFTLDPYSKFFVTGSTSSTQPTPNLMSYTIAKTCLRTVMEGYNTDVVVGRIVNNVPPLTPMILLQPSGFGPTDWGVQDYEFGSTQISYFNPSVEYTRLGFTGYLQSSAAQPTESVARQALNIALLPTNYVEWEYIVTDINANPYDPNSDAGSNDLELDVIFNLPEKAKLFYFLQNTSLSGFSTLIDLHNAIRTQNP